MDELLPVLNSVKADSQLDLCFCVSAGLCSTWLQARVKESKHVHACFIVCVRARVCHQWEVAVPCSIKLHWLLFHWLTAGGAHALLH